MERIVVVLAACLALAGCSDEPSEGDMRTAVEAYTRASQIKAGRPFQTFTMFRKQGCVTNKTVAGEHDCYYAATIPATASSDPVTVNGKGRFRKTDKGLTFQDLGAQPK